MTAPASAARLATDSLRGWDCKDNGDLASVRDPENPERSVLSLDYDLGGVSYCWLYHHLSTAVDARSLLGVSCRVRAVEPSDAVLQSVVKPGRGGDRQFISDGFSFNADEDSWSTAFFPFSSFSGLTVDDRSGLLVVGFVLFRRGRDTAGKILLDDVRIVSEDDVAPAPQLRNPPDAAIVDTTPAFRWKPVPKGTEYRVSLERPDEPESDHHQVTAETVWHGESIPDGVWQWRVRAEGRAYVTGAWSEGRVITIDRAPPALLRAEILPEQLTLVFDDRLDPENPVAGVRLDGRELDLQTLEVDGRRLNARPAERIASGEHRLSVLAAKNEQGRVSPSQEISVTVPVILERVADKWDQVRKELFELERDRLLLERQALGFGTELTSMLQAVPWIANAIDGNTISDTYGWQASHRYRSNPDNPTPWDRPSNARIMECIYAPLMAYTLDHPANPYYHDPAVRARVVAALEFWLDLQGEEGGFPEYNGFGSQELPSTSFGMEFLIEMARAMKADGSFPAGLTERVIQALQHAAVWAATPSRASTVQGSICTNQYCGALYGMWHLYRLTADERWKEMYDRQLEDWIANGQELPFWYEANGVETFAYSRITEWELDRIFIDNGDERILESFRRYYEWCSLNTVVELDETTFIMDNVSHARTNANAPTSGVGYCNHIATVLPAARPWTQGYTMTDQERDQRIRTWFAAESSSESRFPDPARRSYNPFAGYLYFEPKGFWTISEEERLEAVRNLPFVQQQAFTRTYHSERGADSFLFARRPGHYTTFHWGQPGGKQAKDIGLIWIPGFGTLLRSTNVGPDIGYATVAGDTSTYRQAIQLEQTIVDGEAQPIADEAGDADLMITYAFENPSVRRLLQVQRERVSMSAQASAQARERLPLYIRDDDRILADGRPITLSPDGTNAIVRTLRIERTLGGRSGQGALGFDRPVSVLFKPAYALAGGTVWVMDVSFGDSDSLTWWMGRPRP